MEQDQATIIKNRDQDWIYAIQLWAKASNTKTLVAEDILQFVNKVLKNN